MDGTLSSALAFERDWGTIIGALYDSSCECQGRFGRFVYNVHKICLNDILCFSLCKITKASGVRALVTAADSAWKFLCLSERSGRPPTFSRNFSFSKQKGIAPLGGAAYAFIVSEILLKKSASDCYGTFRIIAFYPESTIILIGISNDLESFATPRADFLKITLEICIRVWYTAQRICGVWNCSQWT